MTDLLFILKVSELNVLKYFQVANLFPLMHRFVCPNNFDLGTKWKINTMKVNDNLISVKNWGYVQFCTFFKNQLHCEIPALTVEW
jgi:hypothetical protein